MPIYEYKCQNCGDEFECIVFRTDEPVECPKCGNAAPKKKMSSFGFSVGYKFTSSGRLRLLRLLVPRLFLLLLLADEGPGKKRHAGGWISGYGPRRGGKARHHAGGADSRR